MDKPFLISFRSHRAESGKLSFTQSLDEVPFEIQRVYWLWDIPEHQIRGNHAHRTSRQVVVCTNGRIEILLESKDGERLGYTLDNPETGLYIPPLWWGKMVFSQNALMIGLASDEFIEEDYIRRREEFDGL